MPSKRVDTALRDILHHIELAANFSAGFDRASCPRSPRKGRGVWAPAFAGATQVLPFSNDWWAKPMDEVWQICIERHRSVV
jgi:hypothetical protein